MYNYVTENVFLLFIFHFFKKISTYANTSTDRPLQAKPGGRGIYCCIPRCGSSQYDNQMNKTNIALFSFPNKEKKPGGPRLAEMWLILDLTRNRCLDRCLENQGTIDNSL